MASTGRSSKATDHDVDRPAPLDKKGWIEVGFYESELLRLQRELVKLQEWVRHAGLKVCVVFEGRDAAGVAKACLPSLRRAELQIDDVTRGPHRANRSRPCGAAPPTAYRPDPDAVHG
jgi:hypothetical protein